MARIYLIAFLFSVLLTSCYTQKNILYLQDVDNVDNSLNMKLLHEEYQFQKKDILYVNIKSGYDFETSILNLNGSNSANQINTASLYYNGYSVDEEGYISIPVIGKLYVVGKTLEAVQSEIEVKANTIIKDAIVNVKLINFTISILGEVKNPGSYHVNVGENGILRVLSLAGDLTDYANRKNLLLLRQESDTLKNYRIDLTSKDFIGSKNYFLRPNDVIYVEPVKSKGFRILASDYSVVLTTLTSTLTLILLIINLTPK
ncbi:MAG: polysaccharide export protein [Chlorobi bacterium]|nr:polysaccharide export protein [Chlorobiota bacterium]